MSNEPLSRQLVVRVDEDLFLAVLESAVANERTVAQEVRFRLRASFGVQAEEQAGE